jgi:hypothetical protein
MMTRQTPSEAELPSDHQGESVPEHERWLHEPEANAKLDAALAWAAMNPPRDNLADLEAQILANSEPGA